ncbi:hypothetical protein K435DRAFT_811216 [Dendrothele bispora CBS 962.96]|uniref:Uncharacterized protein n=1 Tax=Dendrothele bispora (strain CBS 962.96) TaxID=1314807 RepID=A0A4S8KTR0_DENBC|nr:hypothetical protein K435DRAFT_811216 [Dendrothele bispora CBS 962.96]
MVVLALLPHVRLHHESKRDLYSPGISIPGRLVFQYITAGRTGYRAEWLATGSRFWSLFGLGMRGLGTSFSRSSRFRSSSFAFTLLPGREPSGGRRFGLFLGGEKRKVGEDEDNKDDSPPSKRFKGTAEDEEEEADSPPSRRFSAKEKDAWLRLEEARGFEEHAGELESEKEPQWVEEWRRAGTRLPIWPGDWEWNEVKKELKQVEEWWKDVCPGQSEAYATPKGKGKAKQKDGDDENMEWAPLDRTSGWDGLWMFLVALMSLMLSPGLQAAPMHEGLAWLTSLQLFVEDMVKTMDRVIDNGVRPL